jgi:ribosomal protein S12 methylthiotransferase
LKQERYDRLMQLQQSISTELLAARVGQTVEVIVDAVDADGAVARSTWDAPEIDGNVYLEGETGLRTGDLLKVVIEDSSEYDLWGRLVRMPAAPARELSPSSPS